MEALRPILPYLRKYRNRLLIAVVGMLAFTLLSLMPPLLMKALVDRVVGKSLWYLLPIIVMARALIPIMGFVIRYFNVRLIMLCASRFINDVRSALYRKVMQASLKFHTERTAGMLVCRIMDDVNMLQRLMSGETVNAVTDVVVVVCSISILISISWTLTGLTVVVMALYMVAYRYFSRRIRRATQAYRNTFDSIAGRLSETVSGVRQVRIYNREEWENATFVDRTSDSTTSALESSMASVNLSTACGAISGFGSTIIIGLGASMVLDKNITFGELTAYNSYLWMLIQPIVRLMNMAGSLNETLVSMERIGDILDAPDDVREASDAIPVPAGPRHIAFEDVHFAYDPESPLYSGLSLEITPGSTVALVGETGCGKSTLISLLMRLWDIQKGAILLDGRDIRTLKLRPFRRLFGVVLQKPIIFDGTLAENIAYGCPGASRSQIETAARAAEVMELATSLPDGLDTYLGSSGSKLSVGEKQRVSIARAILRDPDILIMDEATSALDSHSESLIQKALERVLQGRTSVIVAHRLSTIVKADQIVVMRAGRIVECGRHTELLAAGGAYAQLYRALSSTTPEAEEGSTA